MARATNTSLPVASPKLVKCISSMKKQDGRREGNGRNMDGIKPHAEEFPDSLEGHRVPLKVDLSHFFITHLIIFHHRFIPFSTYEAHLSQAIHMHSWTFRSGNVRSSGEVVKVLRSSPIALHGPMAVKQQPSVD